MPPTRPSRDRAVRRPGPAVPSVGEQPGSASRMGARKGETSALLTIAVSTDDVAAVRFAPNAVWEAISSIRAICHPRAHLLHARLDKLVPAHPDFDMDLLRDVADPPPWVPDIFG